MTGNISQAEANCVKKGVLWGCLKVHTDSHVPCPQGSHSMQVGFFSCVSQNPSAIDTGIQSELGGVL